jgi:hypothetical protein
MAERLRKFWVRKPKTSRAISEVKEIPKSEPKLLRKGCAWCRYAIMADGWHVQLNTCRLRNITLGKDIMEEDGCERFEDVRM